MAAMSTLQKLTEREDRFVEHYSIHKKPSAAYRYAYTTDNMSFDTVASEAYVVRTRPHVAYRLYEIETSATEKIIVSVAEKKQWLKTIVEVSLQAVVDPKTLRDVLAGDPKAAISAIAELNKMDGHHAPKKNEITGKDGAPIETRSMTPAEYKQARSEMLKADDC